MSRSNILITLAIICCCTITANAQFSNLQAAESVRIQHGKQVKYDYYPALTKLRDADSITAVMYIATVREVYAIDLSPVWNGKNWTLDFRLPDSALALALRFKSRHITDDNRNNGYIYPVCTNQEPLPGGRAAMADILLLCSRQLALGKDYAQKALTLYRKEFSGNPAWGAKKELEYYTALARAKKMDAFPAIEQKADSLIQAGFTEKNWKLASALFKLTGKNVLADSINKEIAKRNHVEETAVEKQWEILLSRDNPDSMMAFLAGLKQGEVGEKELVSMRHSAVGTYSRLGKIEQVLQHLPLVELPQLKADMLYQIAKIYIDSGKHLSVADSMLDVVITTPRMNFTDRGITSPAEWNMRYDQSLAEYHHLYGLLKMKQGETDKALKLFQTAVRQSRESNNSINEDYLTCLALAGRKKELVQLASGWIADGGGSALITGELRKAYGEGFDAYLDSLRGVASRKMQWQLEFSMIEKEMPPFKLTRLDSSGTVSLEELKGKVIVLDLWATWCEPCIRSFPAMQQAVHHYKNDKDVVFLFIDTWESMSPAKRVAQVRSFIQKNGYDFQVLLDEQGTDKKKTYKLASALEVEGIPTKIVVDKKGKIRFFSSGGSADAARLLNELSNMIEIARNK